MIIFSVSKETHVMQVRSMHKLISKLDIYSKSTNSQYPMITFTSKKEEHSTYLCQRTMKLCQIRFTAQIKKNNNTTVLCNGSPKTKQKQKTVAYPTVDSLWGHTVYEEETPCA